MTRFLVPIVLLLAATANAAPLQPVASLTLVQTAPAHRDTINFTYTLPKQSRGDDCDSFEKTCAAIYILCWQGETRVYGDLQPARGNSFYLESGTKADGTPFWPDGPTADCVAHLGDYVNRSSGMTWTEWAATTFQVTG